MTTADTFLVEMESKTQGSLDRTAAAFIELVAKESLTLIDLMKLEVKSVLEETEAAALWLADTDDLAFKMSLAEFCGGGAKRFDLLRGRLGALGVDFVSFDPRVLGYSKLFAFFRSLQTQEERAAAGALTAHRYALLRLGHVATLADQQGDTETAGLFRDLLAAESRRLIDAGRKALLLNATGEEGQARARRASFRALELCTELLDAQLVKKFLARSTKKPA